MRAMMGVFVFVSMTQRQNHGLCDESGLQNDDGYDAPFHRLIPRLASADASPPQIIWSLPAALPPLHPVNETLILNHLLTKVPLTSAYKASAMSSHGFSSFNPLLPSIAFSSTHLQQPGQQPSSSLHLMCSQILSQLRSSYCVSPHGDGWDAHADAGSAGSGAAGGGGEWSARRDEVPRAVRPAEPNLSPASFLPFLPYLLPLSLFPTCGRTTVTIQSWYLGPYDLHNDINNMTFYNGCAYNVTSPLRVWQCFNFYNIWEGVLANPAPNPTQYKTGDIFVQTLPGYCEIRMNRGASGKLQILPRETVNIVYAHTWDADLASQAADLASQAADLDSQAADLASQAADLASQAADLASQAADLASQAADLASQAADLASQAPLLPLSSLLTPSTSLVPSPIHSVRPTLLHSALPAYPSSLLTLGFLCLTNPQQLHACDLIHRPHSHLHLVPSDHPPEPATTRPASTARISTPHTPIHL
ncbi:unnamed protein product [Closterium sp. NIES-54]